MNIRHFLLMSLLSVGLTMCARAESPTSMSTPEFERLHQLLKPRSGESRWMEIDWYPSIWEARQKAAAEGKPIFMMAGSGGAPAAGC